MAKRSKHNLSHYQLFTGNMGELIPVSAVEVIPGDTFQGSTSILLRCSPLLAPIMHPVQVRIHHFFVPYRLLWDGWEDFITGGPDGLGPGEPIPTITAPPTGFVAGDLFDHLGVLPGVPDLQVNAWNVRAYNKIYNEFYRDQDLVTERAEDDLTVAKVAWAKDYFTSARPEPQKGPDILLPLGISAPVVSNGLPIRMTPAGDVERTIGFGTTDGTTGILSYDGPLVSGFQNASFGSVTGLEADLETANAVNVNDVRLAFALQRYQEARSRYGSRYTEYLRYLGVRSSDARLQRPEYLGGGKQTISFSEVLQTGADPLVGEEGVGVGNFKGHGIAAMRTNKYRRFFEEHGVVLSLLSVRPRSIYGDACQRSYFKRTKEEYWQRELQHIGQQEVFRREVFAESDANGGNTVLGFQNRYDEYRHQPSTIAGDFRSTLNFWHLARIFGAPPALNASFIECDPPKRVFAEQTQDSLWIMASNRIVARRLVARVAENHIY